MKTITLNKINKSFAIIALLLLFVTKSTAQNAATWGNLYIADNGQMHVFTTDFNFMTQVAPAAGTKTSRTASTYGKISFADAVVVNATNKATEADQHYIDGYFRKYGATGIIFPIGQSNIYAPAKVIPTDATGVDGAYYRANPTTVGATLDSGISAVSSVEYWHILRPAAGTSNAKISLSWSATSGSNVATLTASSITDLTIVGWNGTKWVAIPSNFDSNSVITGLATTLAAGSITSTGNVDLSAYQYFTLASKASCMPLVVSSGTTKTWNGTTWSPSAPTIADPVTLTGNYSGNLSCNSLAMGAFNVTLADGELLEIVNGVTGTGKVIMSSEASLVQRATGATAPKIELTKKSRLMKWRDYMYYGTPVSDNLIPQLYTTNVTSLTSAGAAANAGGAFPTGVFDYGHTATQGGGPWAYMTGAGGGWNAVFASTVGKGFIVRIGERAPWTAMDAITTGFVNFKMVGTANNGDVTVPVTINATGSGSTFELLANPYPSAIDAQKFLVENNDGAATVKADLGSLYFWTANTPRSAVPQTYATTGDYAVWSLAGATNTSPNSVKPDGKIASGQGFRVAPALNGVAGAAPLGANTVKFTNCMRLTSGNNNFFRTANTSVDRFSLNIQDNNGDDSYNQLTVSYLDNATNDYDNLYDAPRNSASTVQLYTLLADNTKLAINARPTFVDTDVVPLGFSNTTPNQNFTITIEDKEGVFLDNNLYVYIHDRLNNVYHDMATPFVFNANSLTSIDNRFEIIYQRNALHNDDFLANEVLVNIKNNTFIASTMEVGMNEIEIFDIAGRKIQSYDAKNQKSLSEPFNHSEGVYIVKIKLNNGSVSTQKLINKK